MLRSLVGSEMCIRDRCWVCLGSYSLNYQTAGSEVARPIKGTSYDVIASMVSPNAHYPSAFYFDRSYPLARILFDSSPVNGDQFVLVFRGHFETINIDDEITNTVPFDYLEALVLNLAVNLAPGYGVKDGRAQGLSSVTYTRAKQAIATLKSSNLKQAESVLDSALSTHSHNMMRPNLFSGYAGYF